MLQLFQSSYKTINHSHIICRPNDGFMHQLKLWEAMKCSLDESYKPFKAYRLQLWARRMKESGSSEVMGLASDPGAGVKKAGAVGGEKSFKCRKCRYQYTWACDRMGTESKSPFD